MFHKANNTNFGARGWNAEEVVKKCTINRSGRRDRRAPHPSSRSQGIAGTEPRKVDGEHNQRNEAFNTYCTRDESASMPTRVTTIRRSFVRIISVHWKNVEVPNNRDFLEPLRVSFT